MYSARHHLLDSRQPFSTGVFMRLIWLVLAWAHHLAVAPAASQSLRRADQVIG
jgi:hypothetical protein